jgi:hypothetical protein
VRERALQHLIACRVAGEIFCHREVGRC